MVNTKKSKWIKWNKEHKKKKLSETLELTYNLFLRGKKIAEIAYDREQKLETIQLHIIKLITMGLISVDDVIGQEKKDKIIETIDQVGSIESIKPIKEALPQKYSFFDIKATLAHLSLEPDRVKK